jgi:hypothetical protein
MGRKLLLPVLSAPCRLRLVLLSLYFGTSFQHALYRLMRNLLKIPRRASGVNGARTGGCTTGLGRLRKRVGCRSRVSHSLKTNQLSVRIAIGPARTAESSPGSQSWVYQLTETSPEETTDIVPGRQSWVKLNARECMGNYPSNPIHFALTRFPVRTTWVVAA